jgi:hypothetical protein
MADYERIASDFATALVAGDFAGAHAMLSPTLQAQYQPDDLQTQLEQMLAYSGQAAKGAQVSVDTSMDDWPDKQADDIGWAYVSIYKERAEGSFAEAVTVIIDKHGKVRELVWGRP